MKRTRNQKGAVKDNDTSIFNTHKNKNKSNKKRSLKPKEIPKKASSKKKDKQKYKHRKQGQKPQSYLKQQQQYMTDMQRKLSESSDYNTKIAEPFNPILIEQQGFVYNNEQYDEKDSENGKYQLEGVSDIQLSMGMKCTDDTDSDSEYNYINKQTNDIIASSEESVSIKNENENENELINNGAVTMLGLNSNEKIKFNDVINMNSGNITIMGSADLINNNVNKNESVTLIGNINDVNEKVVFKEYNKDNNNNNKDIDGDIIRNMNNNNNNNNTETIMGMDINDKINFNKNININIDNKHDNSNVFIGNNETLIGGINENEKIIFKNNNMNNNEYNNEGALERHKNSVLTDLQNIKNNVINALPDPNISYSNPSHPINNKKGVYSYADNVITMYDKSFAMKRSMDNTYNNNKKNNKYDIKNRKYKSKKSKKIMTLKDLEQQKQEPENMKKKSKSKIKSKSNNRNIRRLDYDRKSKKSNKDKTKNKQSWRAFLMRNGI